MRWFHLQSFEVAHELKFRFYQKYFHAYFIEGASYYEKRAFEKLIQSIEKTIVFIRVDHIFT